ncbi:hypothetical protein IAT40_007229 [Kwoniella sp. CBS 6097]
MGYFEQGLSSGEAASTFATGKDVILGGTTTSSEAGDLRDDESSPYAPSDGGPEIVEAEHTRSLLSDILTKSAQSLSRFVTAYGVTSSNNSNLSDHIRREKVLALFDENLCEYLREVGSRIPAIQHAYRSRSMQSTSTLRVEALGPRATVDQSDRQVDGSDKSTVRQIPVIDRNTHRAIEEIHESLSGVDNFDGYLYELGLMKSAGGISSVGIKSRPTVRMSTGASNPNAEAANPSAPTAPAQSHGTSPLPVKRSAATAVPYFDDIALALRQAAEIACNTAPFTFPSSQCLGEKVTCLGDMIDLRYKAVSNACFRPNSTATPDINSNLSDQELIQRVLPTERQGLAREFSSWERRDQSTQAMRDVNWVEWNVDLQAIKAAEKVIQETKGLDQSEEYKWSNLSKSFTPEK